MTARPTRSQPGRLEQRAAHHHAEPRRGPKNGHHRERTAPPSFEQLRHGQLREHDHEGVGEEDDSDCFLGHACFVLREHRQELELRVAGGHEQHVESDERDEHSMSQDVEVTLRVARGFLGQLRPGTKLSTTANATKVIASIM